MIKEKKKKKSFFRINKRGTEGSSRLVEVPRSNHIFRPVKIFIKILCYAVAATGVFIPVLWTMCVIPNLSELQFVLSTKNHTQPLHFHTENVCL